MEISYGTWRGFDVADVPADYLQWLLSKPNTPDDLAEAAQAELTRRRTISLDKASVHALKK